MGISLIGKDADEKTPLLPDTTSKEKKKTRVRVVKRKIFINLML